MVEGHCLQVIKIVHHYDNSCFDWFISGQKSVNPSREAISVLSGKYERVTFVHPVYDMLKVVLKPGFHLQQAPRPQHKKQSDYGNQA